MNDEPSTQWTRRDVLRTTAAGAFVAGFGRSLNTEPKVAAHLPVGAGKLYLIGGAITPYKRKGQPLSRNKEEALEQSDPYGLLRKLCKDAGAEHSKESIVVVTCASSRSVDNAREYTEEFQLAGARNVITIATLEDLQNPEKLQALKKAPMVFFGGGDQEQLVAQFRYGLDLSHYKEAMERGEVEDSFAYQILKRRIDHKDVMIAGTSAGAAAASTQMMQDTRCNLPAFGLTDLIIDTHANRKIDPDTGLPMPPREDNRIRQALHHARNSCPHGLGLDEGVMAVIDGHEVEFIGPEGRGAHVVQRDANGDIQTEFKPTGDWVRLSSPATQQSSVSKQRRTLGEFSPSASR